MITSTKRALEAKSHRIKIEMRLYFQPLIIESLKSTGTKMTWKGKEIFSVGRHANNPPLGSCPGKIWQAGQPSFFHPKGSRKVLFIIFGLYLTILIQSQSILSVRNSKHHRILNLGLEKDAKQSQACSPPCRLSRMTEDGQ